MNRRWTALFLALAFAGPLAAPLVASARAGCGGCTGAARCCCAPARGTGGCSLGRPCGTASGGEGAAAPQDLGKALPEAPVTAGAPQAPPRTVRAESFCEPADYSPAPPVPPPRVSL